MAAARLHGPSIRRRFASRAGALLAMAAAHPFSLLVTLVLLYAAWIVGERIVSWGIIHATFIADARRGCNPEIGSAHVCTHLTNAQHVCRCRREKKTQKPRHASNSAK